MIKYKKPLIFFIRKVNKNQKSNMSDSQSDDVEESIKKRAPWSKQVKNLTLGG
jgi:hypothetical protein